MYLVICFVLYPFLFLLLPFVLLLFVLLLKFALVTSVESIRQDALSRSPINSLFSSSLESLITIRAYNQQASLNARLTPTGGLSSLSSQSAGGSASRSTILESYG